MGSHVKNYGILGEKYGISGGKVLDLGRKSFGSREKGEMKESHEWDLR